MKYTLAALLLVTIALPISNASAQQVVTDWGNGIVTLGEPFETTADGIRFFETEGQAVAITADNYVYGVDDYNNIDLDLDLENKVYQAQTTNDSVLRKYGFLSKDNSSPSTTSGGDSPNIKPFSFTNFLNGGSTGSENKSGNYVSRSTEGKLEGFALALSPEEVRQRRSDYSKKYERKTK